jgi:hypothetical protein
MTMRRLLPVAVLALASLPLAAQGVVIAPHAVYIDARVRSASVLLYNPNPEPAEVTISTFFGYPVTDSLGQIVLRTIEHPDSSAPSAANWIQAFPRRLTIAPLERQTIRLLATPPVGLPDGEYWTRLVIAAKGGQVPVSGNFDTANVKIGLTLEVRTIIGVSYRKGPVSTGVAISNLRGRVVGDSLQIWSRLERQGNAAFVGTVHGSLVDSTGRVRAEFRAPIGIYYNLEPRYAAAVGTLPPGRYRLRLELSTVRDDLDPQVILKAPAVRDSVEVRVP